MTVARHEPVSEFLVFGMGDCVDAFVYVVEKFAPAIFLVATGYEMASVGEVDGDVFPVPATFECRIDWEQRLVGGIHGRHYP